MGIIQLTPWTKNTDIHTPPTAEEKVRLYDERVRGFQLNVAESMLKGALIEWAGFTSLAVVFSYFEAYEQHRSGVPSKSDSGKAFRRGVLDVFPTIGANDNQIDTLWARLRCGLYHNGVPHGYVVIGPDYQDALKYSATDDTWYINPEKVIGTLKEHHDRYVATLIPSSGAMARFARFFNHYWGLS
jgi:hypothetical protein